MSTEHQQYSLDNQALAISRYAEANSMSIVRTFEDGGRSGLVLSGRTGLQELLAAVQSGQAEFEVILVYDVSRWGRFQDSDEGIYYEYLCKRAKIVVHFCAELFPNDASLTTAVLKTVKRTMARLPGTSLKVSDPRPSSATRPYDSASQWLCDGGDHILDAQSQRLPSRIMRRTLK
jgi:hypothetical protein